MKRYFLGWLIALGCASSQGPAPEGSKPTSNDPQEPVAPVRIHPRAEADRVGPGQEVRVAFEFDIAPGYVVAWTYSGSDQPGIAVNASAPSGWDVSPPRFEGPKRFEDGIPIRYGYDGPFAASVAITTPDQITASEIPIDASLRWTVCKKTCTTSSQDLTVRLAVATPQSPSKPSHSEFFRIHDSRLPTSWKNLSNARHSWLRTKVGYELVLYIDGGISVEYIPDAAAATMLVGQAVVPGSGVAALHVSLEGEAPENVSGLVRASDATDTYYFALDIAGPPAGCAIDSICAADSPAPAKAN